MFRLPWKAMVPSAKNVNRLDGEALINSAKDGSDWKALDKSAKEGSY